MKLLTLNIGNSNVSYAVIEDGKVKDIGKIDEENSIKKVVNKWEISNIGICSVNRDHYHTSIRSLSFLDFPEKEIFTVHYTETTGFKNLYRAAKHLGNDRICNLAGVCEFYGKDAIIIDAGTAITIDMLSSGEFKGGVIIPGRDLQQTALAEFTDQLPNVDLSKTAGFPALNTEECIISGINKTLEFGLDKIILEFKELFTTTPVIIGTGGDVDLINKIPDIKIVPELTHLGIFELFLLNKK